ncbi:MAG: polysaccharide deacetylase [Ilumatobacteraceae bacterium]|nr:polysaccharide deacetylase [Ilumatobacteraceae bacterium]
MDRRTLLKRLGIGGGVALGAALPAGTYFAGLHNGEFRLTGEFVADITAGQRQGHVRLWWSVDQGESDDGSKRLALTFDDGPTTQFTAKVLDILAEHKVTATFFEIGELVRRHPDLVRRTLDEGHEIGNHTYDHLSAGVQSPDEVRKTVERGADEIARISGSRPRWMRPVKGHVNGALMQAAAEMNHDLAIWSVSRGDAAADDDVDAVRQNYIDTIHDGAIVIYHDGIGRSAWELTGPDDQLVTQRRTEIAGLPDVIDKYLAEGYEFLSLSDLVDQSKTSPVV